MRQFTGWLSAFAFVVVVGTAVFLYFVASGTDVAMSGQRFWRGMTKWYVVDVHVVFGFVLALTGSVHLALRWLGRGEAGATPRRRLERMAPVALAVVVGVLLVQFVIDKHPVLVADVRTTAYPATEAPGDVALTWSEDPRTTQTIQWRSAPSVSEGVVRYRPAGEEGEDAWESVDALSRMLEDAHLANDRANMRHTAVLHGLSPGTPYVYQAGQGTWWTAEAEFSTARADVDAFSFIYMGDVQNGLDEWGELIETAYERHEDAAFYIIAGDLVSSGGDRDQWDSFFHHGEGVFARRPIVPALGNHDDDDHGSPWMYLRLFELPDNGPDGIAPECAYHFTYANAFFVVLDSNQAPSKQAEWLEQQLARSTATWKFAVYHHPAYSSKSSRDNPEVRTAWCPLFDEYGVDMALQGHDHAYLRTYPLREGVAVKSPAQGTTYVVSVAGTKYYEQDDHLDYTEVGFERLSTYQVIDIRGRQLTYRAFDVDGRVVDELVIHK